MIQKIDWVKKILNENFYHLIIVVLLFLLFKSCETNNEVQLANETLKTDVKDLIDTADKIAGKNRQLRDTISILEAKKQKVKTEIVYIQNKAQSDIKKVATLNTVQIAEYYSKRYENDVKPTATGVILNDTVAKANITELVNGDLCTEVLKLTQYELKNEEKIGVVKDSIIGNLTSINDLKQEAIETQERIIKNVEKSVRKEKRKKNFWKFITGVVSIGSLYIFAR